MCLCANANINKSSQIWILNRVGAENSVIRFSYAWKSFQNFYRQHIRIFLFYEWNIYSQEEPLKTTLDSLAVIKWEQTGHKHFVRLRVHCTICESRQVAYLFNSCSWHTFSYLNRKFIIIKLS